MKKTIVRNNRVCEEFFKIKHKSGLNIILYPMEGYSQAYALFGTNYGSIDRRFKTNKYKEFITVPDGVAHFLEHKLFENEDGSDAFALFGKTGASANAYTSFDKTCYLFSCTDNFKQALENLLSFVSKPYFTEKTVEKEQGIIGQEIRMYEDNPDWQVFFNTLKALYVNNPVNIDIAGTVESISEISDKTLYDCYNTFYNLNNMVLAVAGNFSADEVLEVVDSIIKDSENIIIEREKVEEPDSVAKKEIQVNLEVSTPLFNIGFKHIPEFGENLVKAQVELEVLLELMFGETSKLYKQMYEDKLITTNFGYEVLAGRGFLSSIVAGESKDPKKVLELVKQQVDNFKENGIFEKDFTIIKKSTYGRYLRGFNSVQNVANSLINSYFYETDIYCPIETIANLTFDDVEKRLHSFNLHNVVISIVNPLN